MSNMVTRKLLSIINIKLGEHPFNDAPYDLPIGRLNDVQAARELDLAYAAIDGSS